MFICNECKDTFEVPEKDGFSYEYWGIVEQENWNTCPYCGSADIEEADVCKCGEYIPHGDVMCKTCEAEAYKEVSFCIDRLKENFSLERYEAIELIEALLEKEA